MASIAAAGAAVSCSPGLIPSLPSCRPLKGCPHPKGSRAMRGASASLSRTTATAVPASKSESDGAWLAAEEGEEAGMGAAVQRAAGCAVAACLGAVLSLGVSLALEPPSLALAAPSPVVRLPPLSKDPSRCERAFVGNTIGQANGVADKLLDLRQCDFSNNKSDLRGKTLSSALMVGAKFDNADMTEVVMSKAYAGNASFKGADFTNGVLDRVVFDGSDLTGAKFNNTVLSGSTFDGSDLGGADFEDALIGYVDIQKICRNSTLDTNAREQLGCR